MSTASLENIRPAVHSLINQSLDQLCSVGHATEILGKCSADEIRPYDAKVAKIFRQWKLGKGSHDNVRDAIALLYASDLINLNPKEDQLAKLSTRILGVLRLGGHTNHTLKHLNGCPQKELCRNSGLVETIYRKVYKARNASERKDHALFILKDGSKVDLATFRELIDRRSVQFQRVISSQPPPQHPFVSAVLYYPLSLEAALTYCLRISERDWEQQYTEDWFFLLKSCAIEFLTSLGIPKRKIGYQMKEDQMSQLKAYLQFKTLQTYESNFLNMFKCFIIENKLGASEFFAMAIAY